MTSTSGETFNQLNIALSAQSAQRLYGAVRVFLGVAREVGEDKGGQLGLRRGLPFFDRSLPARLEPEGFRALLVEASGLTDDLQALRLNGFFVGLECIQKIVRKVLLDQFRKA